MKPRFFIFLFVSALIIFSNLVFISAHNMIIVYGKNSSVAAPFVIEETISSQAFYGILNNSEDVYVITSKRSFPLSVEILVPIPDSKTDFSVEIYKEWVKKLTLPKSSKWEEFYDSFSGDHYLKSPELKANFTYGEYEIIVSNPERTGKYVLVIGEKESWTIKNIMNELITLPKLKKEFFGKSYFSAFFNVIGLMLSTLLLIIVLIALMILLIVKKYKRKNKHIKEKKKPKKSRKFKKAIFIT